MQEDTVSTVQVTATTNAPEATHIERGRLKEKIAKEVRDLMIAPTLTSDEVRRSYQHYLAVNEAHVLMLEKTGIIARPVAQKILAATREMVAMGETPSFPIVPELEEMYFNLENHLIGQVGLDIGGQQHTARSRNDLHATVDRMVTRDALLTLLTNLHALEKVLYELAELHTSSVFSGYTHLQPSEPITFAHYLSAVLAALGRDARRLEGAWHDLNRNPLGGGSMGSTTWPIDRATTSALLGFEGEVENSLDAVASRDYLLEILNAMGLLANNLARLATDMRLWSAPEYGYVEVGDSCAVCSSIMPQKKNPWTFESISSFCARVKGNADAAWMTYKGVPYAFTMESMDVIGSFWPAVNDLNAVLTLMTVTMKSVTWHGSRAERWAAQNFSTVTELANTLVRVGGLSFREAHEVVAHAVAQVVNQDLGTAGITAALVTQLTQDLLHKSLVITDEAVHHALDPVAIVNTKRVRGGPAPTEVTRQLSIIARGLTEQEAWVAQQRQRLSRANEARVAQVTTLLAQRV